LVAVEHAGKWLQAFEHRWPEGAKQGLQDWAEMKGEVEAVIRKVNE
jgi:hypothetical protein